MIKVISLKIIEKSKITVFGFVEFVENYKADQTFNK